MRIFIVLLSNALVRVIHVEFHSDINTELAIYEHDEVFYLASVILTIGAVPYPNTLNVNQRRLEWS